MRFRKELVGEEEIKYGSAKSGAPPHSDGQRPPFSHKTRKRSCESLSRLPKEKRLKQGFLVWLPVNHLIHAIDDAAISASSEHLLGDLGKQRFHFFVGVWRCAKIRVTAIDVQRDPAECKSYPRDIETCHLVLFGRN